MHREGEKTRGNGIVLCDFIGLFYQFSTMKTKKENVEL